MSHEEPNTKYVVEMIDQSLLTQARDRQSARKAFQLFAPIPKHTDIRRHTFRQRACQK